MLYFFRLIFIFINIDQETVLNWFGIETSNDPATVELDGKLEEMNRNIESSTAVSFDTVKLIVESLWEKVQDGLTLADIENILFFLLFIRFIILTLRYNLKTSFYITCIGFFAGWLWYRHLIDLISMYRSVLLKLPFLHKLGMDAVQLRSLNRQVITTDLKLGDNVHWYNPGQLIYYAFTQGIIDTQPETGLKHYIDPISMLLSKLQEPTKSSVLPMYYNLYNRLIPQIFEICSKFWTQLSGIAAYAVITRIGKRYCPYLIRWHWTFLLIIGMVEQVFIYFIYRVYYFQTFVLIPQTKGLTSAINPNLLLQIDSLNIVIGCVVLLHIGLIIFGLFHAISGQYFYLPFFVENTELHIGPRPKNSIYSGGNTAWQDSREKEKNSKRFLPKLWYGWFGRGTQNSWQITDIGRKLLTSIFRNLKKQFRR